MEKINFDQLNSNTINAKKEKEVKFNEDIQNARIEAYDYIINDCDSKMLESSQKGYNRSRLYSVEIIKQKNEEKFKNNKLKIDSKGIKLVFGPKDINILTLIFHNKQTFFDDLNKKFNKDNEDKFHCYYVQKKKYDNSSEILSIFVSWGPKNEDIPKEEVNGFKKINNNLFFKNKNTKNELIPKGFAPPHLKRNNYV